MSQISALPGSVQFVGEYSFMKIKTFLIIHNAIGYVVVVREGRADQGWCPCCMDETTRSEIVRLIHQAWTSGELTEKVQWGRFEGPFFSRPEIFGSEAYALFEDSAHPPIPESLLAHAVEMAKTK